MAIDGKIDMRYSGIKKAMLTKQTAREHMFEDTPCASAALSRWWCGVASGVASGAAVARRWCRRAVRSCIPCAPATHPVALVHAGGGGRSGGGGGPKLSSEAAPTPLENIIIKTLPTREALLGRSCTIDMQPALCKSDDGIRE